MRKEENCIILELGDQLYRYDLGDHLPDNWSTDYYNPEYITPQYGRKNAIGAFFFYNDCRAAKQTLAQAIHDQTKKGHKYDLGTITYCEVTDEIRLLDPQTGLYQCSNIISVLLELDIDIISDRFYNYPFKQSYSILANAVDNFYSDKLNTRLEAAREINQFFKQYPPLLGQSLTDFGNGEPFKEMLQSKNYEGYVFMENLISDTFCLFNSNKITSPTHKIVCVESDKELQELIKAIGINSNKSDM